MLLRILGAVSRVAYKMATNNLPGVMGYNGEVTAGAVEKPSLTPRQAEDTIFRSDGLANPTSPSEDEYFSLQPNSPEVVFETSQMSEFSKNVHQSDPLTLNPEEDVEIETVLRDAMDDLSLREELTSNRRQTNFNLLEFSPQALANLRLTPKGKDESAPECSGEMDSEDQADVESQVGGKLYARSQVTYEEMLQIPVCSGESVQARRPLSDSGNSLSHPIFKEPLCLIHSDSSGQLHLNQQTLQLLDSLDTPLVVIGITGSYRSGKSYLMNYLAGRQTGFQVGNTVETCTRGIWIWCLPHPLLPDTTLVWMDTEGLDDPDKGDYNFDMQVIVLTLLLSSTFMYNTQGRIDNTLIKQLGFVSDLTNHLQVRAGQTNESGDDFDLYFPNLFVVVRDFFLELKTKTATITSDEYFEHCLKVKEASNKPQGRPVRDYNEPRIKIRKFFPSSKRYCRTLPNPNKSNYRNGLISYLLGTSQEDLNPDFWIQAQELQELLLNVSPQKTFGQCDKVTGRMFGSMAQCYVAAIEQGDIPCIQSAFQLTAMQENRRILELALEEYRSCMLDLQMPLSQEQLYQQHQNLMRDLLEKYRRKIIFEEAHDFRQEYDARVVAAYNEIVTLNETKSQTFCESMLEKLNDTIAAKFRNGQYLCSGGYAIYKEDLQLLTAKYISTANKGVKSDTVLHKFLQQKESEISTIVAIDKEMSIIRVQEEAEKRQKVEIEFREKMLKDEVDRAREREEHLRKSLMENQEVLQKEMERRLNEQQTKFEQLMKEREENHERLVNELRIEIGKLKSNPVHRKLKAINPSGRCVVM